MPRILPALLALLAACASATPADDDADVREAVRRYTQTGRPDDSLAILGRLLLRSPGHAEARMLRAGLLLRAGRRPEALADYDAVVRANPAQAEALMSRALAQDLEDCEAAAMADADAYLKLRPDDEAGWLLRGWIHRRAGRKTEAFSDFEKARALGGPRWATWHNAGVSSLTARRLDDAERLFAWAAELNPARAEIHVALGRVHFELGRREAAVADFQRAADLANDPDTRVHLGNALVALRRFADARAEFDRAIGRKPDTPAAWYGRAIAELGLGNAAAAERDLDACIERAPEHLEALQQRAMIRIGGKRYDAAEADLVRALKISATCEWVGRLADLYADRGDWTRAATTYESAVRLCSDDAQRKLLETALDRARRERGTR